jgi:hypothetical protein
MPPDRNASSSVETDSTHAASVALPPRILSTFLEQVAVAANCLRAVQAQTQSPDSQPEPLSLEQLMEVEIPSVVGASRLAEQVVDAPATVTIVPSDDRAFSGVRACAS